MPMSKKKHLLVPMPVALHTKLKWRARQEGKSMSHITRTLIEGYLRGDQDSRDIYDEIAEKIDRVVNS